MASLKHPSSQRLAWIEGIRIFAAVIILLYHAQLLITDYAFTPQPDGINKNFFLIAMGSDRLGGNPILSILGFPIWFGFQFVDVFILISGFSLVLSLKGKPLEIGAFLRNRILRILWTFWTVAWLSYPVLWILGKATNSYIPDAWHIFAGATFPLVFDYAAEILLPTSGPWWFVSLILCFTLIFPLLWNLLQRWGSRNLLVVSLLLTVAYRALAVYLFKGHPTYSVVDTPTGWFPFVLFLAKLSTFTLGMVVAQAYRFGKGPVFWQPSRALWIGSVVYLVGFFCQFYTIGWVFADILLPAGLTLVCMVVFRYLSDLPGLENLLRSLGSHSYSFFLIHNFVVDRTLHLFVDSNLLRYYATLPVMILGTLVLAIGVDQVTPLIRQAVINFLGRVDFALTTASNQRIERWESAMGDRSPNRTQQ